jgi:hypothetical protein
MNDQMILTDARRDDAIPLNEAVAEVERVAAAIREGLKNITGWQDEQDVLKQACECRDQGSTVMCGACGGAASRTALAGTREG